MIDKIDGGSPYDYPKITNKRSAGIHAYDAAWQNAISEKEKQEDPGVILDIGANREKKQPEKEQPQSQKDQNGDIRWWIYLGTVKSIGAFHDFLFERDLADYLGRCAGRRKKGSGGNNG